MKQFHFIGCRLLISCLLILSFFTEFQARLLFNANSGIFCRWSQKRTCSKKTPVCVRVTDSTVTPATSTCRYYFTQCQYLIDKCLGQTTYGISGEVVASTICTTNAISVGQTGATCT
ncbi:uncharacterized protein Dwil_GK27474 [Drosophila willistoni]|uniref:Kazal-like domain-containing protein n=1 Tax=Drosophila willistoni TaxID=7260 RepID=A0A0Q9WRH0_DROWI|nr:uncharacterized protein Dwil_GK27474 [Drosophila willistoni]